MTVAFWCVLIAFLLPYVCTYIAKFGGGYRLSDNHDPRDFLDSIGGLPRRAHSAQLNGFEITPFFAAAVIIAHLTGGALQVTVDVLSILFVTSRLLYIIFYLMDWATLRSLVWFVGLMMIVGLFIAAA